MVACGAPNRGRIGRREVALAVLGQDRRHPTGLLDCFAAGTGARGRRAAMPVSRKLVVRSACSRLTGFLFPFGKPGSVAFKSLSSGVDGGMSLRGSDLAYGLRRWPVQGSVERRLSESPHAKAAQHLGCQVQQRVFDMRRRSKAPAGGVDVEVRGSKARPGFDAHRGVARIGLVGSGPVWP